MRIRAGKNKLLIPLTIVTIIIWGVIIYNVIEYFNSLDENLTEVIEVPDDLEQMDFQGAAYSGLQNTDFINIDRDPFEFVKASVERSKSRLNRR